MKKLVLFAIFVIFIGTLANFIVSRSSVDSVIDSRASSAASGSVHEAVATFAGGCFWCIESTFEKLQGVREAISGYTGGHTERPTYEQVGRGGTGHTEAVQIFFDPNIISYEALLHRFWRDIDPTDLDGQFADRGSEYRPAIFYHDEAQRLAAIESRNRLATSGRFDRPVAVEILPLDTFWKAEDYHQDYYKKSPIRYKLYRSGSGRDAYLEKVWGEELNDEYMPEQAAIIPANDLSNHTYEKPEDEILRNTLSSIQYDVTQNDATERPFQNAYWDNNADGIYVDIVSGEPLFSSTTKYKSGTGWPSFWEPINATFIVQKNDYKLLFPRTEVRSRFADSHLGHVFKDGPAPTGLRYCINSAALKFVPREQLAENGYGEYLNLFLN